MTKEECEKALSKLWDNTFGTDCITGEDLDKYVDIIDGLIQYVFNPQPYKYDDLKVGMFVYSEEIDTICLIIEFYGYEIKVLYHEFDVFNRRYYPRKEMIGFCDDSVFPITKVFLEYQGKED